MNFFLTEKVKKPDDGQKKPINEIKKFKKFKCLNCLVVGFIREVEKWKVQRDFFGLSTEYIISEKIVENEPFIVELSSFKKTCNCKILTLLTN